MDIVAILKDFGFPVFCVVALGYFIRHLMAEHKAERAALVVDIKAAVAQAGECYKEHKTEYKALATLNLKAQQEESVAKTKLAESVDRLHEQQSVLITRMKCAYASGQNPAVDHK